MVFSVITHGRSVLRDKTLRQVVQKLSVLQLQLNKIWKEGETARTR